MLDKTAEGTSRMISPVLTIISAVYNVSAYLPEYLASLDAQEVPSGSFEVILVSDGSPDDSEAIITEWLSRTSVSAKLLRKENGGQASARNLGLEQAIGEWVTFCDPDDYLSPNYLVELFGNMELNRENPPSMYVTRLVSLIEATGVLSHRHPLKNRFRDGTRVVNLDRSPDFFHMHGPTAVIQRQNAELIGLRFEEKLRFSFEDAHYVATYLLAQSSPTIGYVTSANYIYRVRAAGNSSVQIGGTKPEKYTDVLLHGHRNLLEQCTVLDRPAPKWLQFMLLYDVFWYFRGDRRVGAPSRSLPKSVTDQFHHHIHEIMQGISEEAIQDFEIMPTDGELRNALLLGYKYPKYRSNAVSVLELDKERGMTRLGYTYSGELPNEIVVFRGLEKAPVVTKTQSVTFLGRILFKHRHIWIPSNGTFSVKLDGSSKPLEFGRPKRSIHSLRPVLVERQLAGKSRSNSKAIPRVRGLSSQNPLKRMLGLVSLGAHEAKAALRERLPRRRTRASRLRAFVTSVRSRIKYQNAWVLMDRVSSANDNAEHLYRYIAANNKAVNIWFVLAQDSPDWGRLSKEGFKLLAFGSKEHNAALVNAKIYASSHLDKFVTDPLPKTISNLSQWKFVFLQHGVTLHDQSAWFNSKKIDLLVTATNDEYESIISSESGYRFTPKEIALTGFPRHDALIRSKSSMRSPAKMVVVSPTWRSSMLSVADSMGNREILPEFEDSKYVAGLRSLLSDTEMVSRISKLGYQLAYLPHPMFSHATDLVGVHPDVRILGWNEKPFSSLIGESAVWITDYSSTAFEAAYADVPVVYFQFDADEVAAGSHIYDSGYFSFENDGFGPVVNTADQVVHALESIVLDQEQEFYKNRRCDTFAFVDDQNSKRTLGAIEDLFRRMPTNDQLIAPERSA